MRQASPLGIGLLATLAACSADPATTAAVHAFASFQDRLLAGDADGVRALVTEESAPAVAALPWAQLAGKQPLQVLAAEAAGGPRWHVQVRDPEPGGAPGIYVVVRENGKLVVDLIATAGLHTRAIGPERHGLVAGQLTPADHDRLRAQRLAEAPTAPPAPPAPR